MDSPLVRQQIVFDRSAIDMFFGYLKERTDENLERLTAMPSSRMAYKHHVWASIDSETTIKTFWKRNLEHIHWTDQFENSVATLIEYLNSIPKSDWLNVVLGYLPEEHIFKTTVHLIIGYDNIVYGEDVALNLNSKQFHYDNREVIYYLIHELAHAGYFRYHPMPKLAKINATADLLDTVKLLTQLEGMGVISPLKLRLKEGGLLDNDYKVLLDHDERNRRVRDYFKILTNLETKQSQESSEHILQVLEQMSGRSARLWYITGCHMAQRIEQEQGTTKLRDLVEKGYGEFFETYHAIEKSPKL